MVSCKVFLWLLGKFVLCLRRRVVMALLMWRIRDSGSYFSCEIDCLVYWGLASRNILLCHRFYSTPHLLLIRYAFGLCDIILPPHLFKVTGSVICWSTWEAWGFVGPLVRWMEECFTRMFVYGIHLFLSPSSNISVDFLALCFATIVHISFVVI